MRSLLNCTIYGLCKCKLLNQVFLRILGVIFLYLKAKTASRLFQRESHMLVEYCFIRGVKSECGSREGEGEMRLDEDLARRSATSLPCIPV